jgi:hypothetical protein
VRVLSETEVPAVEGVTAHEQQVEEQDGETEGVVVGRAADGAEVMAEKLWRGEQFDPDAAWEARPVADLKGIAINGRDRAIIAHQDVAVVDVPDDKADLRLVDNSLPNSAQPDPEADWNLCPCDVEVAP